MRLSAAVTFISFCVCVGFWRAATHSITFLCMSFFHSCVFVYCRSSGHFVIHFVAFFWLFYFRFSLCAHLALAVAILFLFFWPRRAPSTMLFILCLRPGLRCNRRHPCLFLLFCVCYFIFNIYEFHTWSLDKGNIGHNLSCTFATAGWYDIRVSKVCLPRVSLCTHLSTNPQKWM